VAQAHEGVRHAFERLGRGGRRGFEGVGGQPTGSAGEVTHQLEEPLLAHPRLVGSLVSRLRRADERRGHDATSECHAVRFPNH
jgi:hypothetical protein